MPGWNNIGVLRGADACYAIMNSAHANIRVRTCVPVSAWKLLVRCCDMV
jgi:hypothetical protein